MATLDKPKTAAGYDAAHTGACERALVTLLGGLGTIKDSLRLVGGLVPRYLTPANPPDVPVHAGTSDVDIVLNLQLLAEGKVYKPLAAQLKAKGFERSIDEHGNAVSWRWKRNVTPHEYVMVEFLRDSSEKAEAGRAASIKEERVSALAIPHAGIVHDWYLEKRVTAELLDGGGVSTETVRFADATAFIVLKVLAFGQRHENKDAADLIHVMRYAGSIEELARQFGERRDSGKHKRAIDSSLDELRERFCSTPEVEGYRRDGPVANAMFMHGPDADPEEQRIREQRDASGMVTEFLRLVER